MAQSSPIHEAETLIIACGALVRELRALGVKASYLPAPLHSQPAKIPAAVESVIAEAIEKARNSGTTISRIVLGYGDCGTGGLLDSRMARLQSELEIPIERLPGDHCYSFFTGAENFRSLHDEELGTFFLTDYLARHFDQLIWRPLKMHTHPELRDMYFAHYSRVVYLSQTNDQDQLRKLSVLAQEAATKLGLSFEQRHSGLEGLRDALATPVTIQPMPGFPGPSNQTLSE